MFQNNDLYIIGKVSSLLEEKVTHTVMYPINTNPGSAYPRFKRLFLHLIIIVHEKLRKHFHKQKTIGLRTLIQNKRKP